MEGKRLLHKLRLKNFLSYGNDFYGGEGAKDEIDAVRLKGVDVDSVRLEGVEIDLEPLNVLIGVNGSGKSNFIEAISLLHATPRDLAQPIRRGGGIGEWLWKGEKAEPVADIDAVVDYPDGETPLRYFLRFTEVGQRMELFKESVQKSVAQYDPDCTFYDNRHSSPDVTFSARRILHGRDDPLEERVPHQESRKELKIDQSILSQRRDPRQYPELTHLADQFARIGLYRQWNLGQDAPLRKPQHADLPDDFLLEDASNLCLVYNSLQYLPGGTKPVLDRLKQFYERTEDVTVKIQGGTVQLYLHERGLSQPIPASRMSDGALRYLCLLTILCHPEPPPLICIEEPELGLHPDVLPALAELMIEASSRTQLIVSTHSDALVSGLTDVPESVIVCERDDGGTRLRRLDKARLEHWLEKYTLGDVWLMGEIGGNL